MKRIKKNLQKKFRQNDLNIAIKWNLKIIAYLDVTLNLLNNTYKPFPKPNIELNNIHKESNHPPSIIKRVLFLIESWFNQVFSEVKKFLMNVCLFTKKH